MNGKHYEWDWFLFQWQKEYLLNAGKKKIISSINFFLYLNNYM